MKIFVTEIFFMKIVFFVTEKKLFSVVWSFVHVIVKKLLKYIVSFVTEERKIIHLKISAYLFVILFMNFAINFLLIFIFMKVAGLNDN